MERSRVTAGTVKYSDDRCRQGGEVLAVARQVPAAVISARGSYGTAVKYDLRIRTRSRR